ncbi:Ubiquitin-conjugating enzyme E2 15 [Psilocybe cubensis]|uniref:Ubiquitin-conjugating enzyme E2 15 n=1 Tax=Psilocybe cubensis TaxID=181762 RepID=A0ACB8GN72_PSICU|nr:Ubiquitin-conjugating enzyme E2 15 [Psilocybe cubensis]KAH9476909.1 Ubiquitin-conjugating enzyme E2 15 [Psilocybe cubensis]
MSKSSASTTMLLARQFEALRKQPDSGFSVGLFEEDNYYEWKVLIIGYVQIRHCALLSWKLTLSHTRPPDTLYEGGFLEARLSFPPEFPLLPPKMQFITEMHHPNIYKDGTVCISILHAPGEDQYGYEDAGERWMPVHTAESILVSVISLLSSDTPNLDSPANVDVAKQIRTNPAAYKKEVRRLVRKSAEKAFE